METIYYISIKHIKLEELLNKLHSLGYKEQYINDVSFCPYMIVHKNFEKGKNDFIYENINIGLLERLKGYFNIMEDDNIDDFILHADEIKAEKHVIGLF